MLNSYINDSHDYAYFMYIFSKRELYYPLSGKVIIPTSPSRVCDLIYNSLSNLEDELPH